MKKLVTKSCEEIMTTVYKPIEFVIDSLIAQGLYILAGAPKVGKFTTKIKWNCSGGGIQRERESVWIVWKRS